MTVFGWRLSKVLGFCFCGVLMPGFFIWRMETGDDPNRTLGFFVSGCVTGGFARVLYELIRARGAYKLRETEQSIAPPSDDRDGPRGLVWAER